MFSLTCLIFILAKAKKLVQDGCSRAAAAQCANLNPEWDRCINYFSLILCILRIIDASGI